MTPRRIAAAAAIVLAGVAIAVIVPAVSGAPGDTPVIPQPVLGAADDQATLMGASSPDAGACRVGIPVAAAVRGAAGGRRTGARIRAHHDEPAGPSARVPAAHGRHRVAVRGHAARPRGQSLSLPAAEPDDRPDHRGGRRRAGGARPQSACGQSGRGAPHAIRTRRSRRCRGRPPPCWARTRHSRPTSAPGARPSRPTTRAARRSCSWPRLARRSNRP